MGVLSTDEIYHPARNVPELKQPMPKKPLSSVIATTGKIIIPLMMLQNMSMHVDGVSHARVHT